MSEITLQAINDALKEVYPEGKFEKQFAAENELFNRINKISTDGFQLIQTVGGKGVVFPIEVAPSQGVGSRSGSSDGNIPQLPQSSGRVIKRYIVPLKNIYIRETIAGDVIELAEKDFQAFGMDIADILASMTESAKIYTNFRMARDQSGLITTIASSVSNSTTITVNSVKGMFPGMRIDVFTALTGGTQEVNGVRVEGINEDTKTLTLAEAVTVTSGSYVFRDGDRNNAIAGILTNLATTGTVFGLDKTATGNEWFRGKIISSSVGTITDSVLTKIRTVANKYGAALDTKRFWLCTDEVRDQIWDKTLRADKRYDNTVTIAGGEETFRYHGIPIVPENSLPEGYLFLICPSTWYFLRTKDFHPMLGTGSQLMPVPGYDAYDLVLKCYCNFVCTNVRKNPYAYGITEA